ncbi:MAG: ABC transporter permease [Anaerolineae bacterium]|nr:ABC transporter permease [Anaerolineae bacterium]
MRIILNGLGQFFRSAVAGPLVALLLVIFFLQFTSDRFLDEGNFSNVSLQVSVVAIAAIGSTLVILVGGIDLSPGAIVALTSCSLAILVKERGYSLEEGIAIVLLMGAGLGFINGFFATYGRIPAFIVTLATFSAYRGAAFLITDGTPIFSVSPRLRPLFYDEWLGIPRPFFYTLGLFILTWLFLRYTIIGRNIYAVGGNEAAARLSGVKVNQVKLLAFVIAGVMSSIAGILTSAQLNSGSPNYGVGLELKAIAAAVIGGASLAGGAGNVIATLLGAWIVAIVQNGLNLNTVPASWQEITLGIIIVGAVGLDMWRRDIGEFVNRAMRLVVPQREPPPYSPEGGAAPPPLSEPGASP